MSDSIQPWRQVVYYLGAILMLVGFLMFASVFVTFFSAFSDPSSLTSRMGSIGIRAIGGMFLLVVGGMLRLVGRLGLAGSGVVLDPNRARHDLSQHARMGGGLLKDALKEADINLGRGAPPQQVVMIKCRSCGKLNEEDSKFCQECGKEV